MIILLHYTLIISNYLHIFFAEFRIRITIAIIQIVKGTSIQMYCVIVFHTFVKVISALFFPRTAFSKYKWK